MNTIEEILKKKNIKIINYEICMKNKCKTCKYNKDCHDKRKNKSGTKHYKVGR